MGQEQHIHREPREGGLEMADTGEEARMVAAADVVAVVMMEEVDEAEVTLESMSRGLWQDGDRYSSIIMINTV
jgi:hypothetical protein